LKLQPDFGETSTERSLEVVLFLLLCPVLDSKEVLHLDMEEGMRLVLLEACIPLLLVLACKGVDAPPQLIRICHLLLEHGAVRYSAETPKYSYDFDDHIRLSNSWQWLS
jgi:hypothetical protein